MRHSRFSEEEATELVVQTLLGTAKLLCRKGTGIEEIIPKVATKGGITEEGLKVH